MLSLAVQGYDIKRSGYYQWLQLDACAASAGVFPFWCIVWVEDFIEYLCRNQRVAWEAVYNRSDVTCRVEI